MPGDHIIPHRVEGIKSETIRTQQTLAAQKLVQYDIYLDSAAEEFQEWSESTWSPLVLMRNFQNLEKRARERARAPDQTEQEERTEEEGELKLIQRLEAISKEYQDRNPELQARTLQLLRSRISARDTVEDIMRKVRSTYIDISLADEALDFLLETADAATREKILLAKEELNRIYEREIRAGRNMSSQAREFSSQGLGSANALRDLYRNITGNPRDASTLFQELTTAYPYDKMKIVLEFLLHSLGADLKSKGTSISRAELQRLMTETRNMQAILGVFRFFLSRMPMIASSFDRQGLPLPPKVTFEMLAKLFVKFLQERYPSVDKAMQLGGQLGLSDEAVAMMIIFVQYRDAVRQVAPRLFRDEKHRQDMLTCFIETLEEIDETLEEEEEKEK
ncbi:MAG: type III secretion system gatekeeper subunit SctW [Verrucomicrobia bacterium]|nr:type III secretion system gatekeeper subunit SctW [Verrucomicrobiota bacterium]